MYHYRTCHPRQRHGVLSSLPTTETTPALTSGSTGSAPSSPFQLDDAMMDTSVAPATEQDSSEIPPVASIWDASGHQDLVSSGVLAPDVCLLPAQFTDLVDGEALAQQDIVWMLNAPCFPNSISTDTTDSSGSTNPMPVDTTVDYSAHDNLVSSVGNDSAHPSTADTEPLPSEDHYTSIDLTSALFGVDPSRIVAAIVQQIAENQADELFDNFIRLDMLE
ncbi:hypothetical protein AX16_009168 [Volvariella volvacea WC 439]|nr:hypothetical protein AX16_009168 [Volvariella volvacea WC 439]